MKKPRPKARKTVRREPFIGFRVPRGVRYVAKSKRRPAHLIGSLVFVGGGD